MRDKESKREREKKMVSEMIALYCKKKHHTKITRKKDGSHKEELCPECLALSEYACARSDKCPFMETKTFCSNCKVHCYKPEMREKLRGDAQLAEMKFMLNIPLARESVR